MIDLDKETAKLTGKRTFLLDAIAQLRLDIAVRVIDMSRLRI